MEEKNAVATWGLGEYSAMGITSGPWRGFSCSYQKAFNNFKSVLLGSVYFLEGRR